MSLSLEIKTQGHAFLVISADLATWFLLADWHEVDKIRPFQRVHGGLHNSRGGAKPKYQPGPTFALLCVSGKYSYEIKM